MERFLNELFSNHVVTVGLCALIIAFLVYALVEYYQLPPEKRSQEGQRTALYSWIVLIICAGYLYHDIANNPDFYTKIAANGVTIAATAIPAALVGVFIGRVFSNKDKG